MAISVSCWAPHSSSSERGKVGRAAMTKTVIVTGGAGFIGSNFVRLLQSETKHRIVIVDKLTYAGHLESVADLTSDPQVIFLCEDIADGLAMERVFLKYKPSWVVNFAAESHVDRSIDGPDPFLQTNTVGTFVMLETARRFLATCELDVRKSFRFLHVSTDEVYGSLGPDGRFHERSPYAPSSPYAASKAAADHFVHAYWHTYKVPTLLTNCSNNYGPFQFPEKLIPLTIFSALAGKPLRIYGDGLQIRDWLYVEDHCRALLQVLDNGKVGEQYNVGGDAERTNRDVVDCLCDLIESRMPAHDNPALRERSLLRYHDLKTFVTDRPGHDRRYAIEATKIRSELGWTPRHWFEAGLAKTVDWYLSHRDWCTQVTDQEYAGERLGLSV